MVLSDQTQPKRPLGRIQLLIPKLARPGRRWYIGYVEEEQGLG